MGNYDWILARSRLESSLHPSSPKAQTIRLLIQSGSGQLLIRPSRPSLQFALTNSLPQVPISEPTGTLPPTEVRNGVESISAFLVNPASNSATYFHEPEDPVQQAAMKGASQSARPALFSPSPRIILESSNQPKLTFQFCSFKEPVPLAKNRSSLALMFPKTTFSYIQPIYNRSLVE